MRKICLFSILIVLMIQAFGQKASFDDYKPIQSSGTIPQDFLQLFSEQYQQDVARLGNDDKRSVRRTKEKFLMESNYYIYDLLTGGKVMFGDPVSQYVNKVADHVLNAYPDLRKELRFYVIKSPYVNAFSTDKGIILVNLGLLAQLENEAQLAYVLAHEVVHYVKKHNMDLFVFQVDVDKHTRVLNKNNFEDKMLSMSHRSKESELEADKLGLQQYYASSKYSLSAVQNAFDVMLYSYLPFDLAPFNKSVFEKDFFHFPKDFQLDTFAAIDAEKYFKDDTELHPSIEKRLETADDILKDIDPSGRQDYIETKEEFMYVRNLARFESIRLKLLSEDYIDAIYDCLLLQKEFPDNSFLNSSIAAGLYNLSHRKSHSQSDGQKGYKKVQGEPQQLYYFLQKLNKKELNVLALSWCWQAKTKNPESSFLDMATYDLVYDLVKKNDIRLNFFSSTVMDTSSVKPSEQPADTNRSSKYGKIKTKKSKEEAINYLRYAFVDIMKDTAFVHFYAAIEKWIDEEGDDTKTKTRRFKKCRENCIDRVVVADPYYLYFDARGKGKVKFFRTEELNRIINDAITANASKNGLQTDLLSPVNFGPGDVEKMNDFSMMNEWLQERFALDDDFQSVPLESDEIQKVMQKYGTPYLSWAGMVTVHLKKSFTGTDLLLIMSVYGIPIEIYRLIRPEYITYYYQVLYDTDDGTPRLTQSARLKTNFRKDVLNSRIYDSYYQIKNISK